MVDVYGITRDVILLVRDHLYDLQSTFCRISVGEMGVENKFVARHLHRKKLRKEMLKRLNSLKGTKNKCRILDVSTMDGNLMVVVDVLREVRVTTISIVESLMLLMAMPSLERKSSKWSLGLKLKRANSMSF
ncbi:uncharacterized protein LOC127808609 [Diospyros lotus]|uniref:uncharacterized protein LOC127808609 n=1 Tax=Diospyros lotus TaxID=55363 RepID=UPI00224D5419|nr:uncharacterized protein LOC127808609 [Diospyros lotus]